MSRCWAARARNGTYQIGTYLAWQPGLSGKEGTKLKLAQPSLSRCDLSMSINVRRSPTPALRTPHSAHHSIYLVATPPSSPRPPHHGEDKVKSGIYRHLKNAKSLRIDGTQRMEMTAPLRSAPPWEHPPARTLSIRTGMEHARCTLLFRTTCRGMGIWR